MEARIIKVTDKGQISLPTGMRESLDIKQGDELIIAKEDDTILIKKVKREDFSDLLRHSEKVAKKLWNSKEDEVWNNV
ncbi:MAG TPA: AbrB/MazE/SpoVT family DNA-binding domain-containing protein [Nanoarchaeota archaeon]|nr:AbrB/MazE/SpoVT family DNA-binding domain-containing protein [Nanoarchaeota archaeon]HIH34643.1 AbrB/MazE/SpoVT family DNA-binding domain-containing protein [Nanoarchaeota archaeon]HIH51290.1 AbrB/MazE/SpoVT family DNA-binding domain-containing protein [Nanoarchaeota archaeon]HIH65717.1 AbrB/MazE/SpoVT family DNA-binding domain-containing protein [Nanoarchaeota archaeon]